jgi:hypothetical protein
MTQAEVVRGYDGLALLTLISNTHKSRVQLLKIAKTCDLSNAGDRSVAPQLIELLFGEGFS